MTAFRLRGYQERSLAALDAYFQRAAQLGHNGARLAFYEQTDRQYRTVPRLPDLPYVCLRVPTGGGKTIMAAHAVGIAAEEWLQHDHVTCLWLVPSNTIREQTLLHLRTQGDPYRDALESRFDGPVTVMDLAEALYVQRATLDNSTTVIVATLAALRVTDTEGRKIYEAAGALQHHFTGLAPELLAELDRRPDGTPIESLANVLRLRHPVVIMDEAHNARTTLSFETLERFAPSTVIEFTATPDTRHAPEAGHFASNVLHHVSAAELKAEEMIKLPVQLWTHPRASDAITDALARQRELEGIAADEQRVTGERIRPIVLLQAEANRQHGDPMTPQLLKQALVDDHHVPVDQIAIATGSLNEIEGVDLADPACPIRFIITVQALREGWDCPSAYVLCSVAEQASARAVEQLLGRVLRLPRAQRKVHDALNLAYAFVVSESFANAAEGLRDALVQSGFERFETGTLVEEGAGAAPSLFYARPESPARAVVSEAPREGAMYELPDQLRSIVQYDDATRTLTAVAPLTLAQEERLAECFASPAARAAVQALARESRNTAAAVATVRDPGAGEPIRVPQLAVRVQGELELFDEGVFLEDGWRLSACDASLTEAEFPTNAAGAQAGNVDVDEAGRIAISFRDRVANQLTLLEGEPGWTPSSLTVWLDAHILHPDLTQQDAQLFIRNAVTTLLEERGASIEQVAREKRRLRDALARRIDTYRAAARAESYQRMLFGDGAVIEVSPDLAIILGDEARYSPNWLYEGNHQFQRHVLPRVGELPSDGEERACAVYIDQHPLVSRWVRNISNRPRESFWLQTSTDRFYPDFVGELTDGRIFALEYKGEHLWSNDDSREKRAVGELWAERSGGRCVFVMPRGPDWSAIDAAFGR